MANKLFNTSDIQAIANAIRSKNGSSDLYKVSEMADAITNIKTGINPTSIVRSDDNKIIVVSYDGLVITYINGIEVNHVNGTSLSAYANLLKNSVPASGLTLSRNYNSGEYVSDAVINSNYLLKIIAKDHLNYGTGVVYTKFYTLYYKKGNVAFSRYTIPDITDPDYISNADNSVGVIPGDGLNTFFVNGVDVNDVDGVSFDTTDIIDYLPVSSEYAVAHSFDNENAYQENPNSINGACRLSNSSIKLYTPDFFSYTTGITYSKVFYIILGGTEGTVQQTTFDLTGV